MSSTPRRVAGDRMADAATAFLAALDSGQRGQAAWPFPSEDERERWYYTPTDHGGLTLTAMQPSQQRLALRLLASGLSEAAYVTAAMIMGLENVLDRQEGWTADFGFGRGRDPSRYFVRIFGEPGRTQPWAWRFGGHHVSIHHTIADGEAVASTPCFLGAHPASSPLLGPHRLRPLAGAEDLGRELVGSLDHDQLAAAMLSPVPPTDLVGGNRPHLTDGDVALPLADIWRNPSEGDALARRRRQQEQLEQVLGLEPADQQAVRYTDVPRGLAVSAMSGGQQQRLRALLAVYLGRLPDELVEVEAEKVEGERLADLHFAWAGGTRAGQPHYYRVQGPRLVVEYANVADGADHVHSVWRDPANDFGFGSLADHLRRHH